MGLHTELIPRILRDINDGVLALDRSGHIIYMNPQCRLLLGLNDGAIGRTYVEMLFDEKKSEVEYEFDTGCSKGRLF